MIDVLYEIRLCWNFIRIDFPIATVPPLLFSLTALKLRIRDFGFDPIFAILNCTYSFIYFVLFLYTFTLSNQVIGVEEDKINKPQRPIPAGMVTVEGARKRLYIFNILYLLMAIPKGLVTFTLMWQIATTIGHFGGGHKNGVVKNFLNSFAGIIPQLGSAWKLMYGSVPPHIMQWIAYVGMMMFFLLPIQELRDVQGDKILGRKTIPIMLGENITRIVIPIVCSIMPIFMYYVFHFSATPLLPSYGFPLDHLYVLVMTLWLWLLAYRVYVYRTKVQDHNSYLLLSWWYVAILGGTIVLGG